MAASAGNVGLDGLLNGAVGVVEEEDGVAGLEGGGGESPSGVLEDDGGGGGGVVDDGDLVNVIGVDEVLDEDAGLEDGGLEGVEVEMVGLAEEEQLVALLGGDDGGGAAAEAAVVYAGDGRVVMGEFGLDLRLRNWGGFRFGIGIGGGAVDGVVGAGHWGRRVWESESGKNNSGDKERRATLT